MAVNSIKNSINNPPRRPVAGQVAPLPQTGQSAIPFQVPFIQNQGQIADPQVLFYARTFGGTVYVTAEGQLVYALPGSDDGRQTTEGGS